MLCSGAVVLAVRGLLPLPAAADDGEPLDTLPKFPRTGRRTALVFALYGIERVVIEQFRRHPPIVFFQGLTEYQALALGLLAVGCLIEAWTRLQDAGGVSTKEATNQKSKPAATRRKGQKQS